MNIDKITYEELAEIGDFFGYRWNREGYLHYYDTTREQVPPNPLDSYADLDKMWDIVQDHNAEVEYLLEKEAAEYEAEMEAEWNDNIHGFDYDEVVSCR